MVDTIIQLPFNNVNNIDSPEGEDMLHNIEEMNNAIIENVNLRYDRSILTSIDPDINVNSNVDSLYYDEKSFNTKCQGINNLSFIHINIRSAPKNLKRFELFLQTLKCNFPIICCSETFFKASSVDRYTPLDYEHIYDYRPKKTGGGTSIFVKNCIQYESRTDLKLEIDSNFANSCFIEINKKCVNNKKSIIIGCIYKAPKLSLTHFNDKMDALLNQISKENKDVYLLGDININLGDRCSSNLQTQEFRNLLSAYSFIPLVNRPTRITSSSATVIDNIFTNVSVGNVYCSGIFATKAYSDHFPIFSIVKNSSYENAKKTFKRRNFSEKNISKFKKSISRIDWDPTGLFNSTDTGVAFTLFHEAFQLHAAACFPEEIIKMTYENRYPWLRKSLIASIKIKKQYVSG